MAITYLSLLGIDAKGWHGGSGTISYSFPGSVPSSYESLFDSDTEAGYFDLNGSGSFIGKPTAPFGNSGSFADGTNPVITDDMSSTQSVLDSLDVSGSDIRGSADLPTPPDAIDDTLEVLETESAGGIDGDVLSNDTNPSGPVLPVTYVDGETSNVGTYVVGSNGGRFKINADGTFDFDANGDFDDLRTGESTTTSITYGIEFTGAASVVDVVLLQDLSGSFDGDLPNVRAQFSDLYDSLNDSVDANFGVASFVDKPFGGFGSSGDYVYNTDLAISDDKTSIQSVLDGLSTLDGGDGPESQIEALLQLAVRASTTEIGFRTGAQRVVVLTTDAVWHVAGEYTTGTDGANDGDAVIEDEDYPSLAQLKLALEAANMTPIFSVTSNVVANYQSLVTYLGRGSVVELSADSENIADVITDGLGTIDTIDTATLTITVDGESTIYGTDDGETIHGTDEADVIYARGGNDQVFAHEDDDFIDGGSGNDLLDGGAGADTIDGGAGDDDFRGGDLDAFTGDTIDGGADFDRILATGDITLVDTVLASIEGIEFQEEAPEKLVAIRADQVGAGLATDLVVDFSEFGTPDRFRVEMLTATTVDLSRFQILDFDPGIGEADRLIILGDIDDESMRGTSVRDELFGTGGNDLLDGGGGGDYLSGGTGSDRATYANAAAGVVANLSSPGGNTGEAAGDTYNSIENLTGSGFNDTLTGTSGANSISGGNGNDVLIGGGGADKLSGGAGSDRASYKNATAAVVASLSNPGSNTGEAAGDTYSSIENLTGSGFNDTLTGTSGVNSISGGNGNDVLIGGGGADKLLGDAGSDRASYKNATAAVVASLSNPGSNTGEAAGDTYSSIENLTGSAFNDTLTGDNGANSIVGGNGADKLYGGAGTDTLYGDAGNDTLRGEAGADKMYGGAGNDSYYIDDPNDMVLEAGASGTDTIYSNFNVSLQKDDGLKFVVLQTSGDIERLTLTGSGNLSAYGNALNNVVTGNSGNNALRGFQGNDTLYGGAGNDTLRGGSGKDKLDGGSGADTADYGDAKTGVTVNLGTPSKNTGYALGDTYVSIENLTGSNLYGDTLIGNSLANTISGMGGKDVIEGAGGADKLTGGAGADRFVFSSLAASSGPKTDTIYDFTHDDFIDLRLLDANTKSSGNQSFKFIDTHAFTGHAGELRYEKKASDTYIYADVNGDKKVDLAIHLDDALTLKAADFML